MRHSAAVQDGTLVIDTVDAREWYDHIGIFLGSPKITVYLPRAEYASLSVETDTGDVRFENSDAAQISVETDTGDVTGTLLSEKIFITETSTGRVSVPKTVTGGKCEITTSTEDIKITF